MKILVADDHDLVRDAIAAFLRAEADAHVVTAGTLEQALEATRRTGAFDLVLLDYNMPGVNGLEGLTRMIAANNNKPVAILSGRATRAVIDQAIAAGAAGFVPKTLPSRSIVNAVNFMISGDIFLLANFRSDNGIANPFSLTKRELDVLSGVCEGHSNKEIARNLDVQEVTIKLHVKTMCRKMDARNRTHAAMIARSYNMV